MPQRAFVILLLLLLRHSSGRGPCTCKNATELEASPLPKTVERVRFDGEPTTCVASHSQYGEEKILTANFGWNETFNGTYLEIGAQDGDGFSNTLALSTCHRWGGVLIEGSRSNFEKLKVFVQRHQRPRVTAFWGAVCAPPKLKVSFSEECGHGMSVGGDVSQMSQSYKRNFGFKHCPPQPVPCKPMSWYLVSACRLAHNPAIILAQTELMHLACSCTRPNQPNNQKTNTTTQRGKLWEIRLWPRPWTSCLWMSRAQNY